MPREPDSPPSLTEQEVRRLFGVTLSELRESMSLTDARSAVAAAGITDINAPKQYWDPFLAAVDTAFNQLEPAAKLAALRVLASRLSDNQNVRTLFVQHGFEYVDGTFVPVNLLDQREARYLPPSSASELARAMKRLVDGDESGAITAACGAVDLLMQHLYTTHGLGDPALVALRRKSQHSGYASLRT